MFGVFLAEDGVAASAADTGDFELFLLGEGEFVEGVDLVVGALLEFGADVVALDHKEADFSEALADFLYESLFVGCVWRTEFVDVEGLDFD